MNDLQFERRKYRGIAAYGQSKLLMNVFTFEPARRLAGTGGHRELPPSRRSSVEFLERQSGAAHRQADHRLGEAVHADFKTGRRGVPVSRDLSRGGTSLRSILRQVQAGQLRSSFTGSEVDGGSLAVHGKIDQPCRWHGAPMIPPCETEAHCGDATMLRDGRWAHRNDENPRPRRRMLINGERALSVSR